jgi:hypothetical protein
MEERSEGILLRPIGPAVEKLSWAETAREMAAQPEDWSAWDTTASDGLEGVPWEAGRSVGIAEELVAYRARRRSSKRR